MNILFLLLALFTAGCAGRLSQIGEFESQTRSLPGVVVICIDGQGPPFTGSGRVVYVRFMGEKANGIVQVGEDCSPVMIGKATD